MAEGTQNGYLLFVPSPQGYRLEEREGDVPDQGDEVAVGDDSFVVNRVGPSPYPLDARACAYLITRP